MDHKDGTDTGLIADPTTRDRSPSPGAAPSVSPRPEDGELAHFFTHSLDLLCIAGFDGYFKRLNPAWTAQLGWTLEELKARPYLERVHPRDRAATRMEMAAIAAGRETILFENRFRHRHGGYRWLRWNALPAPGGRERIYAIARDITQQKRLQNEIVAVADREQERIGRELHDGLCQQLAGIAALSTSLSRRLAAHADPAAADAAEIAELLNDSIGHTQDLARGLVPLALKQGGLKEALEAMASSVQRLFNVSCALTCDHPVIALRPDLALHLFRITQEAIQNAVAHGRADQIEISLSCRDGEGRLSVRDTGAGRGVLTTDHRGIGLQSMAYRARMIGGNLEVLTPPEGGTLVVCVFPLSGSADLNEASDHVRESRPR